LKKGADISKEKINGETPLFKAVRDGHENIVKYLHQLGADLNKEKEDGKTPLFIACNREKIVKYLIKERGADVNKEDKYGETPIFSACESKNDKIIKYLIKKNKYK